MEWYVLVYDINSREIISWNIFRSSKFSDGVKDAIKKYTNFAKFKEQIKKELLYAFCSKCEYEIICSGLFCVDETKEFKVDVYSQVIKNLDILAKYIVSTHNADKRHRQLDY